MKPPFASPSDAASFGINVTPQNLRRASSRIRTYLRSARWPLDIAEPDDDLIELTCQIAARLGSTPAELVQGVQQQAAGPLSVGFGWDAWKGLSGLTAGEVATLKRMFPEMPRTLSLGAPTED